MADKQVNIEISGDATRARTTIEELKNFSQTSFKKMSDDSKTASKEVAGAFRQMGIRSKADIEKSSEAARAAFLKIKNSGTASANDIKRAHIAMTEKIKRNNAELKTSTSALSKVFKTLSAPLVGLIAIGTAIKVFKDATASALENEIQVNRLKTQVELLGISWDKHNKAIDEAIKVTARYAVTQTGEVSQVLQNLIFVTGDLKGSMDALNLVYDLANLKGISVEESTTLIGKALSGNVEALSRYFVEFKGLNKTLGDNATLQDKAAFAMAFLNEKVAGSLNNLTTHQRTVKFVKNEWASFVQLAGEKIFIVLDKMIILLKQAQTGIFQVAKGVLLAGRAFTWISDKLGLTKDATGTVDLAIDDLNTQIAKQRKNLDAAIGKTDELNTAQESLAGSSDALAEAIKKKNDALAKGADTFTKQIEKTKELTKAEEFQLEQLKKRAAFEQSQQQQRVDFLRSIGREAEAQAVQFTPSPISLAEGGKIPGYGGGDKVPAILEAGEYVLRKEAVKKLGIGLVSSLNRMNISELMKRISNPKVQRFAEGGLVQSASENVNVNLMLDSNKFSMKASKATADSFVSNIKRLNIIHGRRKMPY